MDLTSEPIRHADVVPFDSSPDPRFFFSQSSHGATLDEVLRAVERRDSILIVTGEPGVGKSAFCGAVLQSLSHTIVSTVIPDPALSRDDLLKTLLVDFGIISRDSLRHGPLRDATRTELRLTLHQFLSSLEPLHAFAVVVIDEAHKLSIELLHEIHLLSVLELQHRLLVFILVGRPDLRSLLDAPELNKLVRRVSTWTELSPLARKEARPYVMHRLTVADDATRHFTEAAIDMIHAASGGIPRTVNLICDRALSRVNQADTIVDAEDILNAIAYLQLPAAKLSQLSRDRVETKSESLGSGSLIAANPVAGRPAGAADAAARSSFGPLRPQDALQPEASPAHRDEGLLDSLVRRADSQSNPAVSSGAAAADVDSFPFMFEPNFESPYQDVEERSKERQERRSFTLPRVGWREFVIAAATVASAVAALGFWTFRDSPRPETKSGSPAPPVAEQHSQPATQANEAASTTGETQAALAPTAGTGEPRQGSLALRMGTFHVPENAARTVELWRNAGYPAYSSPVILPSGRTAIGVFFGPYTDRAEAVRDLRRATGNSEYADGHLVRIQRRR